MSNPSGMDIEPNLDGFNHQQPFTPSPTPAQTGEQDPSRPIVITLAMYNDFMNRLAYVESYNDSLRDRCATLAEQNASLSTQCVTLSTQYVSLSNQLQNNLSNHLQSHPSTLEPKIADAPPFSGNRKDLLPFLTKCRLKFGGQPLRFGSEKSKVLYARARLEGPAFGWFQPLVAKWDTTGADPPPLELSSFETFATELTSLYGDPNLAASAEREICRLRQTSAVANYAAKFEEHRQYLEWNDAALRDQFYRGLKDEIKDELAPLGRPATLAKLKELATRLDSRLQERVLERRQAYPISQGVPQRTSQGGNHPPGVTQRAPNAPPRVPHVPHPAPPTTALRTPSHTADGTVPMELGASGLWHLTDAEKLRRRQLGLCNYCGIAGHDVWSCPSIPPRRQQAPRPQFVRQAVMSFELPENPEVDSEKDDAQE